MPEWTRLRPPYYQPDAILTKKGWVHPITGELLICMNLPELGPGVNLQHPLNATARIQSTTFNPNSQMQFAACRIQSFQEFEMGCCTRIQSTLQSTQKAGARISCFIPYYRGINPTW